VLDNWIPVYDVAARYERVIDAPVDRVFRAVEETRPDRIPAVHWLFAIRRMSWRRGPERPMAEKLSRSGFLLLERIENQEIVRGVVGRFWTPSGGVVQLDSPADFRDFAVDGSARSAMCFHLESIAPGRTRLTTETRVQTFGVKARRSFRAYWLLIGPFSGLIRVLWLREIARLAENHAIMQ
jgi:hypothetical protein